jgi:NADH-quinone oxidoreductase subunit K
MTDGSTCYLAVGAVMFVLGAIGFVTRRNLILIVLSAELMLHGVSLTMVTFGRMHGTLEGQSFTVFMLTVAACEAGLLLSLVLGLYQRTKSLDVELWSNLREMDLPAAMATIDEDEPPIETPEPYELPRLIRAGHAPVMDDDIPLEQLAEQEEKRRGRIVEIGSGK